MTNFRALWWVALVFTLFMLYNEWTHFSSSSAVDAHLVDHVDRTPATPDVPNVNTNVASGNVSSTAQDVTSESSNPLSAVSAAGRQRVQVSTDVLNVQLDTQGGDLRFVALPTYPVSREDASAFTLMSDHAPYLFVAQTGFSSQHSEDAPNHHQLFQVDSPVYQLPAGANELRVPMVWENKDVRVEKTYIFHRGSYVIGIEYKVTNHSQSPWQASPYYQIVRNKYDPSSSFFLPTYTGGAVYDPDNKFTKIRFDEMDKQPLDRENISGGWLAMMQHYFVAAFVPNAQQKMNYYSKVIDADRHTLGMVAPLMTVAAGATEQVTTQFYAGPKIQNDLAALAPGLELTVDYGVLAFMAKPMFWLLEKLNSLAAPIAGLWSWGFAIILLTLLLKAAFYKLSEAGYKSMANLRKLAPRLQHLKDNYSHDKVLFQQKMMELYKTEKINPLGGCLPILIQIPVFLALYWVLLEAVELRMTPFLWLDDLSRHDPFYILPVLMGITMVVQQKLNPPPTDPMQEKIMKFLPYVFTITFLFMPSGLVLYWVVNNSLSILQQWYITRKIEAMDKPPAHHQG